MDRARTKKSGIADFACVPHSQMFDFMRMVGDAETPVTIDTSHLHVGSKVRVKMGRLAGLEGCLVEEPNGATKLAIRVDFLGYAKVELPVEVLESVEWG